MNNMLKIKNHQELHRRAPGFTSVSAAFIGNFVIMLFKAFGFLVSGSSSLFSETIHSLADTANQALLMVGIVKSRRAPDEDSSYGYGMERFFWALISACGVFFIGAGVTVYHGIWALAHPHDVSFNPIIFFVLIGSFVVELITFSFAFHEIWRERKEGATIREMLHDGDPTVLAVVYEDGVAVMGVLIATIGIVASYLTGDLFWDALGSIIIGILLAWVAIILILKNKRFLVEKSIPEEVRSRIVEILESDPMIERVIDFKSSVVEWGKYRAKCEVEINGSILFHELSNGDMLKGDYELVKEDYQEFVRFCVAFSDRVPRVIGTRIDEIEARIKKELPSVKHIDIEIN